MGMQDPKSGRRPRPTDMPDEVKEFRSVLRSRNYLTSPTVERELIGLDGVVLNQDLADFCKIIRKKRLDYI